MTEGRHSPNAFLLPICSCGGVANLSHVEPAGMGEEDEIRTYRCAECGTQVSYRKPHARAAASEPLDVPDTRRGGPETPPRNPPKRS